MSFLSGCLRQVLLYSVILLPFWGYSFGLLILGIDANNRTLRFGKKSQKLRNTDLFWIDKQPVFGCNIGKIKSLLLVPFRSKTLLMSNLLFAGRYKKVYLFVELGSDRNALS